MIEQGAVRRLSAALFWRYRREQGWRLYAIPLGFAALIATFLIVVMQVPGATSSLTRRALEQAAGLYFGGVEGPAALGVTLLFIQGPYLIALFSAYGGSAAAGFAIGAETGRGGLECLLAGPFRPSELFLSLLASALGLGLVNWAMLTVGTLGLGSLVLVLLGAQFHLPAGYLTLAVLMPLPMTLWSTLIALFLYLTFPRLAQIRTGSNGNLLQLITLLPALALFLLVNVKPDLNPNLVAGAAAALGVVGSLAMLGLLARVFRVESVLES